MTPAPMISVINQSARVTDDEVEQMVAAAAMQLARDVAPIWGIVPALEFVPRGATPNADGAPCWIVDEPDVEGALGYHDEGADGRPFIKVFVNPTLDAGGTVLSGPLAVSVTLSHELVELVGDGPANIWADGPDGSDYARELADATEADVYDVNGVSMSNFLFPAFFDARAEAGSRLDQLGVVVAPFSMRPGGYQIRRTEPGSINDVFAAALERGEHVVEIRQSRGAIVFAAFALHYPNWKKAGKIAKAARRRAR